MDELSERVVRGWERLGGWLQVHAPPLAEALRPGLDATQIAALEARLGAPLPDEVRTFYGVHDGGGFCLAFVEAELLSLQEGIAQRAMMNDIGWGRDGGPPNDARAVGPVKPVWWSDAWLPFTGGSWMQCIDLDPPRGGRRGQLVSYAKDDDERRVVFGSVAEWLEHWASSLESGAFWFDDDAEQLVRAAE